MLESLLHIALVAVAVLVVICTLLPLSRGTAWWIRGWEFGRLQLLVIGLLAFAGLSLVEIGAPWWRIALLVTLGACILFQCWRMFPYTALAPVQAIDATPDADKPTLSVMVANVLMTNRDASTLIETIRDQRPDLIFFVETDAWWCEQLGDALGDAYPHRVEKPLENTYGLLLYSRCELIEPEVRELLEDEIPSVRAGVRLLDGTAVDLHCIHPKPPYPAESPTAGPRDAEILIIGREIGENDRPTVVAGDFNDVAWSKTTRLFQRISGMLDPRLGRGFFSTFHAGIPIMRWPLDHVFHSHHFGLLAIERLPAFGSDHFPVYVRLQLAEEALLKQDPPAADASDQAEARERIADGEAEVS